MNILRKKEKKYSVVLNSTKYCTNFSTVPKCCGGIPPQHFGTVLKLVQYLVLFNTTEYFFSFFLSIFTLKYQYLVVYGSFNYYLGLKYQYSIIKGSLVLENRIFKS